MLPAVLRGEEATCPPLVCWYCLSFGRASKEKATLRGGGILNLLRFPALLVLLSERSAVFASWLNSEKGLFFPQTAQTPQRAYQIPHAVPT